MCRALASLVETEAQKLAFEVDIQGPERCRWSELSMSPHFTAVRRRLPVRFMHNWSRCNPQAIPQICAQASHPYSPQLLRRPRSASELSRNARNEAKRRTQGACFGRREPYRGGRESE